MNSHRVLVAGASGYIGSAVAQVLVEQGHRLFAGVRSLRAVGDDEALREVLGDAELVEFSATDETETHQVLAQYKPDTIVSCLASRSGVADDARLVDYQANLNLLRAAEVAGVRHFILVSAICVQKPRLAFQHAKLAFEEKLKDSPLRGTIVRPTAFFKSLAGQVERVRQGRPFLMFGDGRLTACKPISQRDLATFIAECIEDDATVDRVLPIGGPGPAICPEEQAALLFELTGQPPRFRRVPVRLFDVALALLTPLERLSKRVAAKAELARIGRYYATESMLVYDPAADRYDADATPEYGEETLRAFYQRVLSDGMQGQSLGEHALFDRSHDGR